jgi:hypothetical protein
MTVARIDRLLSDPPRLLVVGAWAVAIMAWALTLVVQYLHPVLPGDSWQSQGHLVDFRDTVWVPGRFLWSGGNPYDTPALLSTYPWTQGLPVYAPEWFLLAAPLSLLPYLVANVVYQVVGLAVAIVLVRLILRWTLPRYVAIGIPVGVLWFCVWAAGRYALANVSTALVVLGLVLALRGVWLARSDPTGPMRAATACGVALTLLKPTYGLLVVVVVIAGRRFDAAWRGVLAMLVASLPALVASVIASGGPSGFVAALLRNLDWSTSPDAATGLSSPFNVSIDFVSQLARLGSVPPGWVQLAVPLVACAAAAWVARRAQTLLVLTAGVTTLLLLGFVHQFYDLIALLLPFAVGLGCVVDGRMNGRIGYLIWILAALPTLHIHRLTTAVVPGLTTTAADRFDTTVMLIACVASVATTLRRDPSAAHLDSEATAVTGSSS